ncbi:hypothetical protein [Bradyrhizobium cajani]|uniref:Uncharacterized protein n=1 Tax=Bradyrhizobium cajani TaxID=1928661 RepID=A0A844TJ73_9BRAD|nr:hypothetical protein [Bradyrhizobium cajani]MCP3369220.1 hypothetical protein [Bradyrhizobium cajani]MVT74650.1 hypothetical protein [Bradyrhizobium cajani]
MTASKSPPLKVIGIYSLSADWTAYSRFLRQEIDDRDASKFPDELKGFLRQHGRGDEIRPLTAEDRQEWERYLRSYMDDVAIIEMLVTDPDAAFNISEFVQPDPLRPENKWEVAWNAKFLTADGETVIGEYSCKLPDMLQYRVVFAIHSWKPELPLRSSYGELALPEMESLPERLWRLTPYEVPT